MAGSAGSRLRSKRCWQSVCARARASGPTVAATNCVERPGASALSFAQEQFWLLEQFDPGSRVNIRAHNLRLFGRLDVVAMGRALAEVLRRHEVLRTRFPSSDGRPVCRVLAPPEASSAVVDLRSLPEDARQTEARRLAAEELARPFDLENGLPVRWMLLRLGDADHVLLWTAHHIVFDGWSATVLRRELAAIYGAFLRGEHSPLPDPPLQFAQFAARQRDRFAGNTLEQAFSFWREYMAGAPPVLELTTDWPRPATRTERAGRITTTFETPLVRSLKELGRREGATLFMTLLAAFQTLLARSTGTFDIVVGCPVACRDDPVLENLIGPFINTLPIRAVLEPSMSFRTLLAQTRTRALEALAHSSVPFEKLVEELRPERSLAHAPLFQILFQLRNLPESAAEFPGITASPFAVDPGVTSVDLSIELRETTEGLCCSLDYSLDLFDCETARRLVQWYRILLEAVAADPHRPIDDLELLTRVERNQVLCDWNATTLDLPFETVRTDYSRSRPRGRQTRSPWCFPTWRATAPWQPASLPMPS